MKRSTLSLMSAVFTGCVLAAVNVLAENQQGAEIEWIKTPHHGEDRFVMAQRTTHSRLLLTPNEAFFPKLGLLAQGEGEYPVVDAAINGGTNYKMITRWDPGDVAEWGMWIEHSGTAKVRVSMNGSKGQYFLELGGQKKSFSMKSSSEPVTLSLSVKKPGMHLLRVTCEKESAAAQLHSIEVSGSALRNAAVLRKRWRPSAAHTRFFNSNNPDGVRLVIMEMDARPGTLGFYAPVTTPFGYYGPTWKADGLVNTGFNFSLWSYGRGAEEPPVDKLSHLIAIGDPEGKFSGFGHEGTGVKIRGWEPLKGRQEQRQAFAIRMEPGEPYTTYFTYFFASDENRWRLFGIGKTYNKRKPRQALSVGSFVEVPGPPRVQRTGVYERQMRYRGWVVDGKGKLHPFDRMSDGDIDKTTGMTQTDRGLTKDGWFYMQTGGWAFQKKESKEAVALPRENRKGVEYLSSDELKFLHGVPCEITGTSIAGTKVSFNIRNLGKNPEVKVYWGNEEGLTFADRWGNQMDVKDPREGKNTVVLKSTSDGEPLRVRLFLKNHEGQFWSMDTLKAPAITE